MKNTHPKEEVPIHPTAKTEHKTNQRLPIVIKANAFYEPFV
jgi:hypothetical protein